MKDYVTGFGDELLIAWIQNYVIHAMVSNPLDLFNANIYYPYKNTLAFSDVFITSSILSWIPLKIIGQPIATVNFTLISSLFMSSLSLFFLSYYLTRNFFASVIAGLLFIFSPAVLDKKVHLQILILQWTVFAFLFFLHFIKTKKSRYLGLSMTFFILQGYNSFLPLYFIASFFICTFICMMRFGKIKYKEYITGKNIFIALLAIISIFPVAYPYTVVSKEFNTVRDIRDSIHFALQPEDLLYPNEHTKLQDVLLQLHNNGNYPKTASLKPGYIGFIFSVLSVLSIIYFVKKNKKNFISSSFLLTGLTGLVLSLGPAMHVNRVTIHHPFLIPLPYAILYYIIPGFKGFRNSARWEMLFILCMTVLIALFLQTILKKYSRRKQLFIYFFLLVGIVFEYKLPMKFYVIEQMSQFPKVHQWLKTTPVNTSFILMPIYNWDMKYAVEEIKREYYSTIHFRKMMNGYSGFSPIRWQNDVRFLSYEFPSKRSIELIKNAKINYLIVSKVEYDKLFIDRLYSLGNGEYVINALKDIKGVTFVQKLGEDYVYKME